MSQLGNLFRRPWISKAVYTSAVTLQIACAVHLVNEHVFEVRNSTGASMLPTLRVLVFATNSARRPSAVPAGQGFEVRYVASAGKPLRMAPYRGLPRPGAVVGDQVPTDGLLARRLGFTFLHYQPQLAGVPLGPRLMRGLGQLALPLVFSRSAGNRPAGHGDR